MPEEKKKESFTFSDKIKNTQANKRESKSFANLFTSKIGSDGKPRQTLFERTKRDAPFFIAAMVALLLLPFLYKYSGQVEDDTPMITPGYEDAIVNPDRSGFDFGADPDGQISQLSGRDSMDLIVGFGKHRGEEESEDSLADIYRSGLSDSSAASYKRSDMDEEENTTNIYKYRKQAPAQTRAAFRRAATKIGNLKPGGLTGRGGSGLKVGNWGGGLKAAAQKVRGPGQVNSTKPVSLQPLQAAGKPSRSYFGQGAAQEARRSKDAMSKGNAMQALMDAQMKPVEPGRIGGLASGDFGGPGGGNGNLQRNFAYNGKEPWWWDLMKTRSQMEWEAHFKRKWKYIDALDDTLINIGKGLLNCLITGNSDGDPDTFLGTGGGAGGKDPTCCGKKKNKIGALIKQQTGLEFGKEGCNNYKTLVETQGGKCPGGWDAGHGGGDQRLNGWQVRGQCLGIAVGKYTSGTTELAELSSCENMVNKFYQVTPSGEARGWNTYIYVVARNYMPETSKALAKVVGNGAAVAHHYLCTDDSDSLQFGSKASAGASVTGTPQSFNDTDRTKANNTKYGKKTSDQYRKNREREMLADMYNINPESEQHACVIYVQRGDTFNYRNFQTTMIERFRELLEEQGEPGDLDVQARKAFTQLDLMFIESVATKDTLSRKQIIPTWLGGKSGHYVRLPMMYWRFYDAYVRHKGTTSRKVGGKDNVDNRDYRVEGADYVQGETCYFNDSVSITCEDNDKNEAPVGTVTFKQGYKGQDKGSGSAGDVTVVAQYLPLNGTKGQGIEQRFYPPAAGAGQEFKYPFEKIITVQTNDKGAVTSSTTVATSDLQGSVRWTLLRGGQAVDVAECRYNMAGNTATPTVVKKGTPPQVDDCNPMESEECCTKTLGKYGYKWDPTKKCYDPKAASCDPMESEECCTKTLGKYGYKWDPTKKCYDPKADCDPMESEECCTKTLGKHGYKWDATKKCYKDPATPVVRTNPGQTDPNDPTGKTRLAQLISQVPATATDRKVFDSEGKLQMEQLFGATKLVRGTDTQHCATKDPIAMDSQAAMDFVNKVIKAYNAKYPNAPIQAKVTYGPAAPEGADAEGFPTDGEFIDALNIAANSGIAGMPKTVPAAAVCELGRDMVRMSVDPHTKSVTYKGKYSSPYDGTVGKIGDEQFHNDLGAFLVYIGPQAMLYPAKYVVTEGECDMRFMSAAETPCKRLEGLPGHFHYNNYGTYTPIAAGTWGSPSGFAASLRQAGLDELNSNPPLAGLASSTMAGLAYADCGKAGHNCASRSDQYKKAIALLVGEREDFEPWQGNACTAFYGGNGPEIKVEDVLKYVSLACEKGLDVKPHGVGSAEPNGGNTHNVHGQTNNYVSPTTPKQK